MFTNNLISNTIKNIYTLNSSYFDKINITLNLNNPFKDKNTIYQNQYAIFNKNSNILTPTDINNIKNIYLSGLTNLSTYEYNTNISYNNFFTYLPSTYLSQLYTANTIVTSFTVTSFNTKYITQLSTVQEFIEYNHQQIINLQKDEQQVNATYYIRSTGIDDTEEGRGITFTKPFKTLKYILSILQTKTFSNSTIININILDNLVIDQTVTIFHKDITELNNSKFNIIGYYGLNNGNLPILLFKPNDITNINMFNILSPCNFSYLICQMDYHNLISDIKSTCFYFNNKATNTIQSINIFNFNYTGITIINYSSVVLNLPIKIIMLGADSSTKISYEDPLVEFENFKNIYINIYLDTTKPYQNFNKILDTLSANYDCFDNIKLSTFIPHYEEFKTQLKQHIQNYKNYKIQALYNHLTSSFNYLNRYFIKKYNIYIAGNVGITPDLMYNPIYINYSKYCELLASANALKIFEIIDTLNKKPIEDILNTEQIQTLQNIYTTIYDKINDISFNYISGTIFNYVNSPNLSGYINNKFSLTQPEKEKWLDEYTKVQLATSYISGNLKNYSSYLYPCKHSYINQYRKVPSAYQHEFTTLSSLYIFGRTKLEDETKETHGDRKKTIISGYKYAYCKLCNTRYDLTYENTKNLIIKRILIPDLLSNKFNHYHTLSGQISQSYPSTFYLEYTVASTAISTNILGLSTSTQENLYKWLGLYMWQASTIIEKYRIEYTN